MPISISDPALKAKLRDKAKAEGFDGLAVTRAALDQAAGSHLKDFVARNYHGDMSWLAETASRRQSPEAMWPNAKTAIMLAMSYAPDIDPLARLEETDTGVISVYALNRDYHDVIKGKLKNLAHWLVRETKAEVKVFVDTAPLMEKPLAARAGLGWQGKHTNLVSRALGSWFLLGTILTAAEIEPDEPEEDHCGSCRACLDICPTKAFPEPRVLDARRCISYLTIEHKGHIAHEFRRSMGNRIYGCDDCLAVCPWNKFASEAREMKLKARDDLVAPRLADLLALDDAAFRRLFSGSPVKRIGRERFIRNCLIAAGNSGDKALVSSIKPHLADPSVLVKAMAVWALAQLAEGHVFDDLRRAYEAGELDENVKAEWQRA
jgi:epoxyqueuosine reductase